MTDIHHVPVVGKPPAQHDHHVHLVFNAQTGKMIGRSPHVQVKQTVHRKRDDGTITTTLKITPVKGA